MGAIDDFIARASKFDSSQIINTAVSRSEQSIINLNTKGQLSNKGIDSENNPLTPPYHRLTIERKRQKGQTTKFVTLRDTGEFHSNFKIIYKQNSIEISADPTYHQGTNVTQYLRKRYGNKLFGLVDFNVAKLREIVKPSIIQQSRQLLNG